MSIRAVILSTVNGMVENQKEIFRFTQNGKIFTKRHFDGAKRREI